MASTTTTGEGAVRVDLLEAGQGRPGSSDPPPAHSHDQKGEGVLEALEEFPAYTEMIWKRVAGQVNISGRVLEMGCGIGSISRLILGLPGVTRLVGVDVDASYVARVAREIPDSRLEVACASAEEYCPGEGLFDRVVSINVLEHVKDDRAALANFHRLLRPGGECAILVPAHPSLYSSLDRAIFHHRRYSRVDFAGKARSAGFEPARIVHFNPLGALGWWINGKVLRRPCLSRTQVSIYTRSLITLSACLDRINPFPFGISLIARLVKPG
jgi:SAM-dependent methyltransferase